MACTLGNKCAKNLSKRTVLLQLIIKNVVKCFFGTQCRMIALPYGEKNYDNILSRFHLIPKRHGQTDRRTDRIAISISRVSVLTRGKNERS